MKKNKTVKKQHNKHKTQALLIAGMHRSGTSALTKTLSILGADLPKNLMPPMKNNNDKGFWESRDLEKIHDSLLESAGSAWNDWSEFNPDWFKTVTASHYKDKLLAYLESDFEHSPLYIIKDPRICRFLPIWLETTEKFASDPFVIIPFRHPLEVANSLKKRDGMTLSKGLLLWLRHVLDAIHYSYNTPRAFISYENLLKDWDSSIKNISEQANINWPKKSISSQLQIEDFLDINQKHQIANKERLHQKDIPDYIAKTYAALQALEKNKDDQKALETIKLIRNDFNQSSLIFAKVAIHEQLLLKQKIKQCSELSTKNENFHRKQLANQDFINTLQEAHAKKDLQISELQNSLSKKEKHINELQKAQTKKDKYINELRQTNTDIEKQLQSITHKTTQQINNLRAEKSKLAKKLKQRKKSLKKQLNKILQQRGSLKQQSRKIDMLQLLIYKITESKQKQKKYCEFINLSHSQSFFQKIASSLKIKNKKGRTKEKDKQLIINSGEFDPVFYLINNPDVLNAEISPLEHFCSYGWKEGRNPNSKFDIEKYSKQNPETIDSNINPFVHYLLFTQNLPSNN